MKLADPDDTPPLDGTYWVVPGKLLAGPYPGSADDDEARAKVGALLGAGARTFLNLMAVHETNRSGSGFSPYEPHLGDGAAMLRRPIVDQGIPTNDGMQAILDTIDAGFDNGVVYVHCWGGVGRTGTTVGCWLLRHGLAEAGDVLNTLAVLRRADTVRGHRESPETSEQRRFVNEWPEP